MGFTTMHFGKPSYTIANRCVEVFSSVQGGHTTASFTTHGKPIFPFFVAPWWKEAPLDGLESTIQIMRGDYFCFPFGINAEPVNGRKQPLHGRTANECWDFVDITRGRKDTTLTVRMALEPDDGEALKVVKIVEGHPVVYSNHVIRGFSGMSPAGTHPCIQCGDAPGSAYVDMSEPVAGFTAPAPLGTPEKMGYSLLKADAELPDRKKALTVYGTTVDLTRYPLPRGYEDAVLFVSDPSKEFVFTSVAVPDRGFLYFQLKDPRVLSETLFWMPNGGSYYAPLHGRLTSTIGVGELTAYFFYGRKPSMEANPLSEKGFRTCLDFSPARPTQIRFIAGAIPVEKDFKGVQDIVRTNDTTITILGKAGEKIDVPCAVDFLKG